MSDHVVYSSGAPGIVGAAAADTAAAAALNGSGVTWSAVFAGAAAAAALAFILLILGVGLGLSSVSPWSGEGLSAKTMTFATAGWLVFTQLAAAGIGGYLAGRLRVKWAGVHTREVYFRDTAHGFLAWCVASLVTAAVLGSAVGNVISGGARVVGGGAGAAAAVAGAGAAATAGKPGQPAAQPDMSDAATGYFIDMLFRPQSAAAGASAANGVAAPAPAGAESSALALPPGSPAAPAPRVDEARDSALAPAQRLEVLRIFAHAWPQGALPDADRAYVGQLVARRTGASQADAEKRVTDVFNAGKKAVDDAATKAREAADAARKAGAYGSLWMFFSLLLGAFVASLAATYGGRRRDMPSFAAPRTVAAEPVIDN